MIWIFLVSLSFLSLITFSDIKSRQIPIIYLLGETIVSFLIGYHLIGMGVVKNTIVNLVIITFQLSILWGWNIIREGKSGNHLWTRFGKGDFFMLTIIAINLSSLNLLLFIVIVCLISLIFWIGFSYLWEIKNTTIPFAGFLSIGMIFLRVLQLTGNGPNIYSDNKIMNLIYGI